MRFNPHRQALLDFHIEEYLIGIELIAKIPEWRPLQPGFWIGPEIAF
jgi:hypothetical protein